MKNHPIYVEIPIHTNIETLWEASQDPVLHAQWDLRFSSITYVPKKESEPQLFSYKTKMGFTAVEGWGKSVGSFHAEDGSRTSSLHFGTDQSLSPIREGKGYWKYQPKHDDTITFLTQYDYTPGFGRIGDFVDHLIFRPLMGWGTALSFDVLKKWLEQGETPASQYVRFFSHWILTFFFFFIWIYHGLIPKLIYRHPGEMEMVQASLPLSNTQSLWAVLIIGMGEVIFGWIWLFYRKKRHLFFLQMILLPLLTLSAVLADPRSLVDPFNPFTFNLALFVLSMMGYFISAAELPTAANCKRKKEGA
ncbi:DoxX-like family protein [Salibacterium lacus]|uniref:DoxX-like family protein n=1 Tax=Salibacterium lacus TaxID=1898109 RepID=A0ABW5T443_9BACI